MVALLACADPLLRTTLDMVSACMAKTTDVVDTAPTTTGSTMATIPPSFFASGTRDTAEDPVSVAVSVRDMDFVPAG